MHWRGHWRRERGWDAIWASIAAAVAQLTEIRNVHSSHANGTLAFADDGMHTYFAHLASLVNMELQFMVVHYMMHQVFH